MSDEQGADGKTTTAAFGARALNMSQRDVQVLQAIGVVVFVVAMLGMFTSQSVRLSQLNRETASLRTQLVGANQEISDLCVSAREAEKRLEVVSDDLRCLSRSLDDVKRAQQPPELPQLASAVKLTPAVHKPDKLQDDLVVTRENATTPKARRWYYLWLY